VSVSDLLFVGTEVLLLVLFRRHRSEDHARIFSSLDLIYKVWENIFMALDERSRVNRLQEVRVATGRSVAGLAHITGLSKQTIYDLEAGHREGSLETWLTLANALDVPVEELSGHSYTALEEYKGKALAR
jgi:DNA-binding XRE family transcriptional regulator